MMRFIILSALFLAAGFLPAQTLSLEECHQTALDQSPLQNQKRLIVMQTNLQNEKLSTAHLPQFGLNGQGTWQSEVITFPSFPGGIEFPEIPKLQFNLGLNINQVIYDGGAVKQGKIMNAIGQQVQIQQIDVEVNKVKESINQLYFSILILDKNEEVINETLDELNSRLKVVKSGVDNGVVLSSSLDEFQKQILTLEQRVDQIKGSRAGLKRMLADWMGKENLDNIELVLPKEMPAKIVNISPSKRPEYALFDLQRKQLEASKEASKVKLMPKVSAFATGGIGQPNPLNFIEVDPSAYLRTGIMVAWTPWDWKSSKKDQEIMSVKQEMVEIQRQQFYRVMNVSQRRDQEQITSLENLIEKDQEIIALQTKIINQSNSQLENGVITATDYLTKVKGQIEAQLNLEIHKIQLIQAKANILTRAGSL